MNKFELFTMIYFAIDDYYNQNICDELRDFLSNMCPFTFKDIGSADPAVYAEFAESIRDREITIDNSLEIAESYCLKKLPAFTAFVFDDKRRTGWADACRRYLAHPHKGSDLSN